MLPGQTAKRCKIVYSRREILNTIFYLVRTGGTWCLLRHNFPQYRIVFHFYPTWQKYFTWATVNDLVRDQVRQTEGRNLTHTAAIIDSQSVKTTKQNGPIGFHIHKLIKGRKRPFLVNILGLLLVGVVHTAEVTESVSARPVLEKVWWRFSITKHI